MITKKQISLLKKKNDKNKKEILLSLDPNRFNLIKESEKEFCFSELTYFFQIIKDLLKSNSSLAIKIKNFEKDILSYDIDILDQEKNVINSIHSYMLSPFTFRSLYLALSEKIMHSEQMNEYELSSFIEIKTNIDQYMGKSNKTAYETLSINNILLKITPDYINILEELSLRKLNSI